MAQWHMHGGSWRKNSGTHCCKVHGVCCVSPGHRTFSVPDGLKGYGPILPECTCCYSEVVESVIGKGNHNALPGNACCNSLNLNPKWSIPLAVSHLSVHSTPLYCGRSSLSTLPPTIEASNKKPRPLLHHQPEGSACHMGHPSTTTCVGVLVFPQQPACAIHYPMYPPQGVPPCHFIWHKLEVLSCAHSAVGPVQQGRAHASGRIRPAELIWCSCLPLWPRPTAT